MYGKKKENRKDIEENERRKKGYLEKRDWEMGKRDEDSLRKEKRMGEDGKNPREKERSWRAYENRMKDEAV